MNDLQRVIGDPDQVKVVKDAIASASWTIRRDADAIALTLAKAGIAARDMKYALDAVARIVAELHGSGSPVAVAEFVAELHGSGSPVAVAEFVAAAAAIGGLHGPAIVQAATLGHYAVAMVLRP